MTDKGCETCKFQAFDLDGFYCVHPKSMEIVPAFGASTNRMSVEGHCRTDKYGNKPEVAYALWEGVKS